MNRPADNEWYTNEPDKNANISELSESLWKLQNEKNRSAPFLIRQNGMIMPSHSYTNVLCCVPLNQNVNKFYTRTVAHWMINVRSHSSNGQKFKIALSPPAAHRTVWICDQIFIRPPSFPQHPRMSMTGHFLFRFFVKVPVKSRSNAAHIDYSVKLELTIFAPTFWFPFNFQLW